MTQPYRGLKAVCPYGTHRRPDDISLALSGTGREDQLCGLGMAVSNQAAIRWIRSLVLTSCPRSLVSEPSLCATSISSSSRPVRV